MPDLFRELRGVVTALDAAGIPFALCGGLAMAVHGHYRATIDIDLLAPAEAVEGLARPLAPLGVARREARPARRGGGAIVVRPAALGPRVGAAAREPQPRARTAARISSSVGNLPMPSKPSAAHSMLLQRTMPSRSIRNCPLSWGHWRWTSAWSVSLSA